MKLIQYLILFLFIFSGVLGYLLYQQKSGRIKEQLEKKDLGWNPVSIKKMYAVQKGHDTLWLAKQDGVWKTNRHFDGMGIAPQLLIYLSTMKMHPSHREGGDSLLHFHDPIILCSFDKNGRQSNYILIGDDLGNGQSYAHLNHQTQTLMLSSSNNHLSIRKLLENFISVN
jgi:hypothetical protein